ncbi:MAG: 30S ribosome-binding factor RbfA [Candidatus Eisenbacteria bacterium]|nr:30S ribosome-binding factor RbfA [Candidatus Eisenbacteria bacterium]
MRIRPERVAHLMRREVADILERRLRDPRLGATVTVTDVQVTHDLSFARVFVTVLGDEAARGPAMEALRHASGFVRHELGSRLDLREVPEIRFEYDASLDQGRRVEGLLRRIEQGDPVQDEESE